MSEPLPPEVYARVFEGMPEGRQILDEMIRRFHKPAKLDGGIDAIITTYHREGARSVVDFILRKINQAHGVNDDEDEVEP